MTGITRQTLFGKLNTTCYRALETATGFCRLRGHAYVELVHWLHQIELLPDSDLRRILRRFSIDEARLGGDITRALDALPRGAGAVSDLSAHVEDATQQAWLSASLVFGSDRIRSGHLLHAGVTDRSLSPLLFGISSELRRVSADALRAEFDAIVEGSPEAAGARALASAPGEPGVLTRYTVDLTADARAGKLDPVIGRDAELRRVIDVLLRRRQNNPLLTGDAGVGKTAIVEGLALRIAAGEVPPALKDVALLALDLNLLQAGAGVKGEFEQRLQSVISAVQSAPHPVILFVDEAHTLIGAGGQEGTGDAANILKPALARGTLRTIGATTWAEYKRYIEKDPALSRRFQAIPVAEPEDGAAIAMMRRMVAVLEKHHGVGILDEAVEAAVTLSRRYIAGRRLPDKALSLLDTACARVGASRHGPPDVLSHRQARLEALAVENEIARRESWKGQETEARLAGIEDEMRAERAQVADLKARWQAELALVARLQAAREEWRDKGTRATLAAVQAEHEELTGEAPLVLDQVDRNAVAAIVQDWTGIPLGRLLKDEAATLLSLADALAARVVGQDQALEAIARRIQTSRAGLEDPAKPIGVFLLCGPSGVGKTETALALADLLLGGESDLITINMSEFQEAHSVSSLKGAPPGYVGHGQGGVLTEAVRRRPHAVILLDEVEKAHPDVHKLFFQVFDKGVMEDGEGLRVDFRNTLILLTCNIGSEEIAQLCRARRPDAAVLEAALHDPLRAVFPPALLGRMVTLPYYPLSDAMLDRIVRLQLERVAARLGRTYGLSFTYAGEVVALIAARARHADSGGRMVDAILTHTLLPRISRHILGAQRDGGAPGDIRLDVEGGEFRFCFDAEQPALAAMDA